MIKRGSTPDSNGLVVLTFVGSSGLAGSHGHAEDGVGSELVLVLSSVKLEHQIINGLLVNRVHIRSNDCWCNDLQEKDNSKFITGHRSSSINNRA